MRPIRLLLQTTIPRTDDDWHSGGAPSFVDDPPGSQVAADRAALDDIKTYVRNVARWLAPAPD